MYKLMTVDDDALVRGRLKTLIPFEKLGLTLCGEAEDGALALELFLHLHPQIVILDINIPIINGLDLARRILEEDADTGIIIITGFGTLEHARKAIKVGTADFLLKPLNAKEIETALSAIITRLEEKRKDLLQRQKVDRLLRESLPLLRERFLTGLLTGAPPQSEESCRDYLHLLGSDLASNYFCVAILLPDYVNKEPRERLVCQTAIENITIELLTAEGLGCLLYYDALQRAVVVVGGDGQEITALLEKKLLVIREKLRQYFSYDFYAGIGTPVQHLCELGKSWGNAEIALGYKNVFGENHIVNIKNIIITDPSAPVNLRSERDKLVSAFLAGDRTSIEATLRECHQKLLLASSGSENYVRYMYVELFASLLSTMREMGVDVNVALSANPYMEILSVSYLYQIQKRILLIMDELSDHFSRRRENRCCRLINEAKAYIARRLNNPTLTLSAVSEEIELSPVYFSRLFKRETSCTFTEYLNRERIERAKDLLLNKHMRIYEISDAVGYNDSKYFIHVFKQIVGCRPREYREQCGISCDTD